LAENFGSGSQILSEGLTDPKKITHCNWRLEKCGTHLKRIKYIKNKKNVINHYAQRNGAWGTRKLGKEAK
jgi:hypothetical protein